MTERLTCRSLAPPGAVSTTLRLKRSPVGRPIAAATSAETPSVSPGDAEAQAPLPLAGAHELQRADRQRLARRRHAVRVARLGVEEADDDGLAAAVEKEVAHGERHRARVPETAEAALEVDEAVDGRRDVLGAGCRAADEGGDRGRDADDRAHAARYFLNLHA